MSGRLVRCAYAALVLAGLVTVPGHAATCAARSKIGRWTYVASPPWPADDYNGYTSVGDEYTNILGSPATDDSALTVVGPGNPRRILLSNQRSLLRSLDGGCTWTLAFTLSTSTSATMLTTQLTALGGIPTTRITQVAVPWGGSAAARSLVYLLVDAGGGLGEYAVLRSDDDGTTWHNVTPDPTGLAGATRTPQPGEARYLAVAPSSPATAYLCVNCYVNSLGANVPPTLYVTRDKGATWTAATMPVLAANDTLGYYLTMTVDPADAASLWLRTAHGLYHSADGGAHWTTALKDLPVVPVDAAANYAPVSVFHRAGSRSASVVLSVLGRKYYDSTAPATVPAGLVSTDGGKHWQKLPDVPLGRLGLVTKKQVVGPLVLSYDAAGLLAGYLPDTPYQFGATGLSAVLLLRRDRWLAAHPPYRTATYPYDPDGVFTTTSSGPPVLAIGLDGSRGATPAVVEYEVPR
jgi:hypothetical protein